MSVPRASVYAYTLIGRRLPSNGGGQRHFHLDSPGRAFMTFLSDLSDHVGRHAHPLPPSPLTRRNPYLHFHMFFMPVCRMVIARAASLKTQTLS